MSAETQRAYKLRHPDRVKASQKLWQQTATGKASHSRARAAYRANHRAITLAHHSLTNAVRRGKLAKEPCGICSDPNSQGHHYLGYEPQHHLDVVWLCDEHHKLAHR